MKSTCITTSSKGKKVTSLYLHIPFCDSLCPYCDFAKVYSGLFDHRLYLARMKEEIEDLSIPTDSLSTIYIGGGTPSSLTKEELSLLLSYLHSRFPSVKEFSMEANPESLSEEKIGVLSENGVNRISLGVQSVDPSTLQKLGRKHRKEDVEKVLSLLRKAGIENINLDFIYGFPFAGKDELAKDISFALESKVQHLSFYSLQIEPGTLFQDLTPLSDEELRRQYDLVVSSLKKQGFLRYEVSNFSFHGKRCLHNLNYWNEGYYYAAGISASGYLPEIRYTNTKSITSYLKGENKRTLDPISEKTEEFEYLMTNLRLVDGFLLSDFKKRFHKDFLFSYKEEIQKAEDYLSIGKSRIRIKARYLYTMDSVLLLLLKDD
ncbi:MAG: radical SAM family heme chaperone HemW [Bacilli bacterium]|jgi:oxygen-independent coproporphyrinogen-3 oxidase